MATKRAVCTSCGQYKLVDTLDLETNQAVCRKCFNHSFGLYKRRMRELERERANEIESEERIKQTTVFGLFIGSEESFTERVAQQELLCDLWSANGVTWEDVMHNQVTI